MSQVSINRATAWTQEFLRREWRLALPVALALVGLPAVVLELAAPLPAGATTLPPLDARMLLAIPAMAATLVGGGAVTALALVPGISVGEALRLGSKRAGVLFVASLLGGLALGAAVAVVAVLVSLFGTLIGAGRPAMLALMMIAVGVGALLIGVRLALLTPLVIDRPLGPVAALREGWRLTRGSFWRLAAALALLLLVVLLFSTAVQASAGAVGLLLARVAGLRALGALLPVLAGALVNALVSLAFWVFVAALYRDVAPAAVESSGI